MLEAVGAGTTDSGVRGFGALGFWFQLSVLGFWSLRVFWMFGLRLRDLHRPNPNPYVKQWKVFFSACKTLTSPIQESSPGDQSVALNPKVTLNPHHKHVKA